MKIRPSVTFFLAFALSCLPLLVLAAGTPVKGYLLVDDLPFVRNLGAEATLSDYLKSLFNLGLGLAVTFAVLMLVFNGIKYMVSDVLGEKEKAKTGMWNAVIGLVIVFGSVLILETINPQLTQFNLQKRINDVVSEIKKAPPGPGGPAEGDPWPSDADERNRLSLGGVEFNNVNCTRVGQENCTSVAGLNQDVIAKLINLKTDCGCTVRITGGTEHWLHNEHGNNRTVDLSASGGLNTYLGGAPQASLGKTCGEMRTKDGVTYRWEDSSCTWPVTGTHWHVAF